MLVGQYRKMKLDLEYLAYASVYTWPKLASDACSSDIDPDFLFDLVYIMGSISYRYGSTGGEL